MRSSDNSPNSKQTTTQPDHPASEQAVRNSLEFLFQTHRLVNPQATKEETAQKLLAAYTRLWHEKHNKTASDGTPTAGQTTSTLPPPSSQSIVIDSDSSPSLTSSSEDSDSDIESDEKPLASSSSSSSATSSSKSGPTHSNQHQNNPKKEEPISGNSTSLGFTLKSSS